MWAMLPQCASQQLERVFFHQSYKSQLLSSYVSIVLLARFRVQTLRVHSGQLLLESTSSQRTMQLWWKTWPQRVVQDSLPLSGSRQMLHVASATGGSTLPRRFRGKAVGRSGVAAAPCCSAHELAAPVSMLNVTVCLRDRPARRALLAAASACSCSSSSSSCCSCCKSAFCSSACIRCASTRSSVAWAPCAGARRTAVTARRWAARSTAGVVAVCCWC